MEAFHIEFIIFLISLIFIDKRLTNYDLIKLFIIFIICTLDFSPSECAQDKNKFLECKDDCNDNYRSIQKKEDKVIMDDKMADLQDHKTADPQHDKAVNLKNSEKVALQDSKAVSPQKECRKFFKNAAGMKYNRENDQDKIKLTDILKKGIKE